MSDTQCLQPTKFPIVFLAWSSGLARFQSMGQVIDLVILKELFVNDLCKKHIKQDNTY